MGKKFDIYDNLKDFLEESYPDDVFVVLDLFDDAVVGVSHGFHKTPTTLVYSKTIMRKILMTPSKEGDEGMSWEEAEEFLEFNTYNTHYDGDLPDPIFIDDEIFREEDIDHGEEDQEGCECLGGQRCESCDPSTAEELEGSAGTGEARQGPSPG